MTDQQAILAVKAGDSEAFAQLYSMHKRRVYSLCLRMVVDHAVAEDLTQEAFLMAFRRIQTFRGDSAFSTWLHRIAVNTVLMHMRQRNSRGGIQESIDDNQTPNGDYTGERFGGPDHRLVGAIDRVSLMRAIEQLPPGYRMIFILHDVEGYEHSEIANLLGCSVGNTKSQLHKARIRLRKLLAQSEREIEQAGSDNQVAA